MPEHTVNGIKALIIDDELQSRRLLRIRLESLGYRVLEAEGGQEGLTLAAAKCPELVLLDLRLPDIDGRAVLKRLRQWSAVPVIVVSASNLEDDMVEALENGADDYVSKPFSVGELMARLRAAQRRSRSGMEFPVFRSRGLEVDLVQRVVKVRGETVSFTGTEYAVLRVLIQGADRVLTRRQIMTEVWGPNSAGQGHYLHIYISRLRAKVEVDPERPELIETALGVGYRLRQYE